MNYGSIGRSDIVVKVARPMQQEYRLFRPGQTIFSFLYLQVASPDLFEALVEREITAVAYEMIRDKDGFCPILLPMSEVAGRPAPTIAGQLLMNIHYLKCRKEVVQACICVWGSISRR